MLLAAALLTSCLGTRVGFQGKLTDPSGNPVPDGDYEVEVRFWTEAEGGTSVFTETKTVQVQDGLFNMDVDDFPPHLFSQVQEDVTTAESEDTLFMEVTVEGETLSPRRKIPGAAYATALVAGSGVVGQRPDAANVDDGGYESALTVINSQPAYDNPGYGLKVLAGNAGIYADNRAGDGTAALNPSENPEDNPDIILGGYHAASPDGETAVDTFGGPGVIASDPQLTGSDVHLRSNDEIWLYKDWDNNEASEFRVYDNGTDDQQLVLNNGGNLSIDGTYSSGGADYAELMEVEGNETEYEPGDVLVISDAQDRAVERSSTPRSTRVIGVYSSQPGVLGGAGTPEEQAARRIEAAEAAGIEDPQALTEAQRRIIRSSDGMIEVAVAGIVPVKVTGEDGPILRGDLLTTSSTPGHAMKAVDPAVGTVLGKAMGTLESGTGTIEALVALQ
jgi:hypothetical protein